MSVKEAQAASKSSDGFSICCFYGVVDLQELGGKME